MRAKVLFLFFFIWTYSTSAQVTVDSVVVTGSKIPLTLDKLPRQVTIINAQEINEIPGHGLNEILEVALGADIRQRGPFDIQADAGIRGGTFEQTLILVNGIKMTDAQTGHHNLNLPVTRSRIERIEILQGGGSRLFGANAFSGIINIILKENVPNQIQLNLQGGENDLIRGGGHLSYNGWKAGYEKSKSNGYITNTDFDQNRLYVQKDLYTGVNLLQFYAAQESKDFGAQKFYSSRFPDQFEATKTQFASAKISGGHKVSYNAAAYLRRHTDRFELFRESDGFYRKEGDVYVRNSTDTAKFVPGVFAAWNYYSGHNYHRSIGSGLNANISRNWNDQHASSIGLEGRYEDVRSNVLGEPMDIPIEVPGEDAQFLRSANRYDISLYLEHQLNSGNWNVSGGTMAYHNSDYGFQLFPGLDAAYKINHLSTVFASVNRSFRLPSYTDLYYSLGGAEGSKDLKPEFSMNYELGFRRLAKNQTWNASFFRRSGRDLIDWVIKPNDTVLRASNITELDVNGIDSEWKFRNPNENDQGLKLSTQRIGYSFLWSDQVDFPFESLYVLDFLSHKLALQTTLSYGSNWYLNLSNNFQDRKGSYQNNTGQTVDHKPFLLTNARLKYSKHRFEAFVNASNLFNVDYFDRTDVAQPGRWITGGLNYTFDLTPK